MAAIMQVIIEKHGFTYCGIIYLANGDERLAYQKISHEPVLHQKSFQELTVDELYKTEKNMTKVGIDAGVGQGGRQTINTVYHLRQKSFS